MMKIRADRRVGLLLGGVVLLVFVSIGATVALPANDPSVSSKHPHKMTAELLRGQKVFRSEGFASASFSDPALRKAFFADPDHLPAGMPSFAYLSKSDRKALAAYLRSRKLE